MAMPPAGSRLVPWRLVVAWRIAWTIASLVAVQIVVCGLSAAPVVLVWQWLLSVSGGNRLARWALFSLAIAPSYAVFALCLTVVSPLAMRLLRWHTPPDADMRIADMDWALMRWVRFGASIHVVRAIAGMLLRGTPLWTTHLRLNGARLGKRVYINSLGLSDYNLIECGDDVVIGGAVHLAGHTVENGVVKTARVRLGDRVTVGLGSVIEIGVEIGSGAQVGALSFVPKFAKLEGGVVYTGAPAVPLAREAAQGRAGFPRDGTGPRR
jgi:acetyltransferase-like isoleucine patch superfamily enzyme